MEEMQKHQMKLFLLEKMLGQIAELDDAPELHRPEYRGLAAIKCTLDAGIPLKNFYAKSKDNDPASYTTDQQEIIALWNQGRRQFKAFLKGQFIVLDIDRKPGKIDGLENFYKLWPPQVLPAELQDIIKGSFPCYAITKSGGFHLFFRYDGVEIKISKLAQSIEIKEWQITAPGCNKENGEYVLHGEFADAPPFYGLFLDHIEKIKSDAKRGQEKAKRSQPRTHAAEDRPRRFHGQWITLNDLVDKVVAIYSGHHERQVSFAGRASYRGFYGDETLAYVKTRPDIFGDDSDTENTILSVFKANGGRL
jgi:hypothetical protein